MIIICYRPQMDPERGVPTYPYHNFNQQKD